ncbi:NAD-dependent epimerase/dehydratase family protein [Rhodopseudomonas sp. RCAM05734]|uniref:NAD-dependent epimerase/dehydratase family protein n=1 Tax=Rhodopseudomonas sp. RCAM05734 TaxID=3457549 RepID=UPI004044F868
MEQSPPADARITVAVTGATGYIGRIVVARLLDAGAGVVALSRRRPPAATDWRRYDLSEPLQQDALDGIDAVIHLAAQTHLGPFADAGIELVALDRLIEAARKQSATLVFVSSQAAQDNAPTGYGQSKWRCEKSVLAAGGIVVRPGLVYGGAEQGLFGTLCRLVRASPVVPHFVPAPNIQPVHVEDLAEALLACATRQQVVSGSYQIAAPEPVGFSTFLKLLADIRFDRVVVGLPLPMRAIVALADARYLPRAIVGIAQRLKSLSELPAMDTPASLTALQVTLRPLRDGLGRSGRGRRRRLIGEARTLLRYVLRGPVPCDCIKHYVRAVEALYHGEPLLLRPVFRRWPSLLAIADQPTLRRRTADAAFWKRVDLATVCAETSVDTVARFFIRDQRQRMTGIIMLGLRIFAEAGRQMIGLLAGARLDRLRPRTEHEPLL